MGARVRPGRAGPQPRLPDAGHDLLWWADLQKGSSRPLGFVVQFVVNVLQGASDFTVIGLCAATAFIAWRVAGTMEGGSE